MQGYAYSKCLGLAVAELMDGLNSLLWLADLLSECVEAQVVFV